MCVYVCTRVCQASRLQEIAAAKQELNVCREQRELAARAAQSEQERLSSRVSELERERAVGLCVCVCVCVCV